jgi:protoporphyrinogen/coproporphyrinogen III oxidase
VGNKKIIIVGAGVGGLSAGFWLSQRGYAVEILEATNRPGGRMAVAKHKGDIVDCGAQFYHTDFDYTLNLIDALNMTKCKRSIKGKLRIAMKDGSFQYMGHKEPYMKILGLRGNLQLYRFAIKYGIFGKEFPQYRIVKDIPEYDDVEVQHMFMRPEYKRFRDYFLEVVSQGEQEGTNESVNLYSFIHSFRMAMKTDFFGLAGGVASLTDELSKVLPVQYESPVRQLEKDGAVKKANHVIVATAPPRAAQLMPEGLEEQKEFFESFIGAAMPMAIFWLDRPLPGGYWCYYNDPGIKKRYWFAVDGRFKIPDTCPSGKSALVGFSGYPISSDLMELSDEEILKIAQEDLETAIPGFSKWIDEAVLYRHSYGGPRYSAGSFRRVLDFKEKAKQLKGVSFVGDGLEAGCMESAIRSGAEAVARVSSWGGC